MLLSFQRKVKVAQLHVVCLGSPQQQKCLGLEMKEEVLSYGICVLLLRRQLIISTIAAQLHVLPFQQQGMAMASLLLSFMFTLEKEKVILELFLK